MLYKPVLDHDPYLLDERIHPYISNIRMESILFTNVWIHNLPEISPRHSRFRTSTILFYSISAVLLINEFF